ncbi:MarR family winged helix-turn-helix transcriptional regulator [Levilactobacillus bambusae]|nr:MarR family transcriptional regulator [Levilactobacillus bambusae]
MANQWTEDETQGLGMLSRIMRNDLNRALRPMGLNDSNYFFIFFIADHPGASQDDLVRAVILDHSTIARSVAKLVKIGYLVRQPDPVDGRASRLFLTPRGEEIKYQLIPITQHAMSLVFDNLTPTEQETVQALLTKSAHRHEKERENL